MSSLAIGMMLVAYLFFAVVDTSTKWLMTGGLAALQVAFMRYATHLVICLAGVAIGRVQLHALSPRDVGLNVLRASLLVGATAVNFIALQWISLTVASSIMFAAPIVLCAVSGPILGEHVSGRQWFFVCLGFLGVLIIVQPFGEDFQWAALLMLIPASGLALYSALTRKLAGQVGPGVMQLVLGLVGTVALGPFALASWVVPVDGFSWLLLSGLGAFAWAGHELLTRAHKHTPANVLMPYSYSLIVYLTISGYLIFGDVPASTTYLGAAVIVFAGLAIWRTQAKTG